MMAAGATANLARIHGLPTPQKTQKPSMMAAEEATNLARIHGLPTPQKTKPKKDAKKKEGWQENT